MNWLETKSKIDEIVSHSNTVIATIEDSNKLFDFIDSLSRESKAELYEKYKNSNGPVTGIRKEVAEGLLKGNIDRKNIMVLFETGKQNYPKKFTQYKNLFSVLYP